MGMVSLKWLPWRYLLSRVAQRHGYLDPLALAERLLRFAQPSEVDIPYELMRAGAVFHARGLINSRVIQHNLDWVWPYWAEQQFDPCTKSFVPRAFSITHVNLTHRNWTAIGYPDCAELPIVDPRGLLTPFWDGWSLDAWVLTEDGFCMLPQRTLNIDQRCDLSTMQILTDIRSGGLTLHSAAWVGDQLHSVRTNEGDSESDLHCCWRLQAQADRDAWLVVSLRPQNPEGVSFIHSVALRQQAKAWLVDQSRSIYFSEVVERHHVSDYRHGDVHIHLQDRQEQQSGECEVGMVTAAALFRLPKDATRVIDVAIPLVKTAAGNRQTLPSWQTALKPQCQLQCPDKQFQFLYNAAVRSLILMSPDDVYPGPYTYKRFWFRDAAFIIYGLLCTGFEERARRALRRFPERQDKHGYFCSQEGEWDSNGEVLWLLQQFEALTGKSLAQHFPEQVPIWHKAVACGADWIIDKRLSDDLDAPHAGLLPAGFSAEHLGPNDYYYWDSFWGVAGLRAAAAVTAVYDSARSQYYGEQADNFLRAVDKSIARHADGLKRSAIPASPYRRLDAGAIGSVVASYPLRLYAGNDNRILDTVEYLLDACFINDAFFQDMIHSGLNAYLTMEIAQVLLRAGDQRYLELMDAVARLASSTGQWPEAIHPHTLGGCMGDGHHTWASAEWVLLVRNCLVREEETELILGSGIPRRWLQQDNTIRFGPAPTAFGRLNLTITVVATDQVLLEWDASWHKDPPSIHVRIPGFLPAICKGELNSVNVMRA